jgi:large subunit ribosomal protein L32
MGGNAGLKCACVQIACRLRFRGRALQRFVHHQLPQERIMAVQQNKKSPSKRGMHRSHNALNVPGIAVEPTTGEIHLRHHISPSGFYRGRKVLKTKSET